MESPCQFLTLTTIPKNYFERRIKNERQNFVSYPNGGAFGSMREPYGFGFAHHFAYCSTYCPGNSTDSGAADCNFSAAHTNVFSNTDAHKLRGLLAEVHT
jgi:hypothetical protein